MTFLHFQRTVFFGLGCGRIMAMYVNPLSFKFGKGRAATMPV
ncbi:hypothetical protein NEIELOOT_00582 [Neisseria elongata subsp. glycolytica ATCC 29315]|uniref:Uncharacterized protein n=1 Tax=Neisseria elongata subsp. glycolytica ATCC 29315 TaxID=546263 RepID=D4DNB3_NEIEG|nr:hypothetical protein NEIELOOT_00582 [Neisseria elongata subsp. glycolytica ATCC 29315]